MSTAILPASEQLSLNVMNEPKPSPAPREFKNVRREVTADAIAVLTFDRPDSVANIFDRVTLEELNAHLDTIERDSALRGVVLTSAKPGIFIAGADLHSLSTAPMNALREMVEFGQRVFSRLAALPLPTAAAIHGACLGGGFEVCLACDFRLATPDKATKLGLPEVQLGILPAWGGSTRLPRLIGLPKALDLILAGKTVVAKQALKLGLVDDLVPHESLLAAALKKVAKAGRKPHRATPLALKATNNLLVANLISMWTQPKLFKKTRGHYPAVLKALEVVTLGVGRSEERSLKLEADAICMLAQTEAAKNLIRVFFLQERAKKLTFDGGTGKSSSPQRVERATVIGAGVMGAGIAQWLAARGVSVMLRDINTDAVGRGMATVAKLFADGTKRRTFTPVEARAAMDRISPVVELPSLRRTDVIIEAAVEKMDLKKDIFRKLEQLAGPDTILATNTSALSVTELADSLCAPERVVGIHFFNPVHRMQLVEVIHTPRTDAEVVRRALKFVQAMGKLPVLVKDSPGFVVNRVLMPYLVEAARLFEAGAEVTDLDEAMLDFGMPMGPLRLVDEVGTDVSLHVAETLASHYHRRMAVPEVLSRLVKGGHLGRKSGEGFYLHRGKEAVPSEDAARFVKDDSAANLDRVDLELRMVLLMVNEAARCVEEGIVSGPEDVDFAMIMGAGFAPFRGGPLRHADTVGVANLVREMNRLVDDGEERFAPCALLKDLATKDGKLYPEKGVLI
ncbi:MAG: 3-hydroxyacyl-CoA dehydrogenase / enoyl-CoA hydratase / 3-hydroxybutyryl-CoA epimerase [Limisphaerales bacterium]|nr:MAG: 3-hydroxyacyl-CoA dehydrogenase / enoyl-CoA hydratase / 3-hydroxybutyryl-CoA epimerase [Limisphaerales bacterium]KAG0509950.1 MAG: 3-hydroxyacyl-CoA dehydrogenase / enoyl-CoA hydratase / 3-hydroxybutyryl-CoA epimerase [Limisphaerales bacterium]TXT45379.1 MAG: 3-hydroxyacyl-CoA dehydrogenase / enoyl-CoA hydratase / 3-hydroxybutyryl-CoA epimerase [Limisphaerales bacterium]